MRWRPGLYLVLVLLAAAGGPLHAQGDPAQAARPDFQGMNVVGGIGGAAGPLAADMDTIWLAEGEAVLRLDAGGRSLARQ
ncbi:MAG: hypothetical protein JW910_18170, partial [Anaerolineae bacterium]|nr:hypothetical protein [Anaerolineae bacterium]